MFWLVNYLDNFSKINFPLSLYLIIIKINYYLNDYITAKVRCSVITETVNGAEKIPVIFSRQFLTLNPTTWGKGYKLL